MIFKKNVSNLIFITKDSVSVYINKKNCTKVNFPNESFKGFTINNSDEIKSLIKSAIDHCKLENKKVVVVLDTNLYFFHSFEKSVVSQADINMALGNIPLDPIEIAYKVIGSQKKAIVATSKSLCGFFQTIIESFNVSVEGVYPSLVFGDPSPELIDTRFLKNRKISKDLSSSCNFIQPHNQQTQSDNFSKKSKKIVLSLLITSLALLVCSVIYYVYIAYIGINNTSSSGVSPKPVVASTPIPTSSKNPTPTPKNVITKDEVSIVVLNSTKTPGLAAKTQEQLNNIGFTNVQAANYPLEQTSTTLFYKENITKEYIDEIYTYLISSFGDSVNKEQKIVEEYSNYSLVIILGTLLTQ